MTDFKSVAWRWGVGWRGVSVNKSASIFIHSEKMKTKMGPVVLILLLIAPVEP